MELTAAEYSLIASTIRTLAMDAVQRANSGHPGMPMGCAEIAAVLWGSIINHDPADPRWVNRDRFVLSAGHGSMLLYAALHLAGYDITLDDIRQFRQLDSKTPGHPEYRHTPGVETTTGPLGQGFANAVGMALAARLLANEFNAAADPIIDHRVYALVSDGDLMEGISAEAASLAGHWGLGNIIFIYDDNGISIEGSTALAFSDDVRRRFEACHWHVQSVDGHDCVQIARAVRAAQAETGRPSLIIAKTAIAKGSPGKEGSEDSHGAPLGADEVKKTKINIGCDPDAEFCVPQAAYDIFARRREELATARRAWDERFSRALRTDERAKWGAFFSRPNIDALRAKLPAFKTGDSIATRSASGSVIESLFAALPNIVGGSADLAPSNKSFAKGHSETGRNAVGRNIHFGIREHAMGAIQNGIAYYGGFIPYSATFFVFMDYMRPPVRIAALAGLQAVYVFTHDSLFVGEDGPTHQPVEHLAAARAIPNLTTIRPADAEETREAWLAAIANTAGPTALALSRQNLPVLPRITPAGATDLHRGAYVIWEAGPDASVLMLASGSEVQLAIEAAEALRERSVSCRVISFPSWELFDRQDDTYRRAIIPTEQKNRVVIEAGRRMGWERYAGDSALYITMEGFGVSAPQNDLAKRFGLTRDSVVERVLGYLAR
ncbi:MAG TPA: transketolase [Spirochaetota bacterium]|nr:transketolase [Spirochaetota bacterium]HNT13039.1 transketolase [Spirochaetota bacterium]